MRFIHEYTPNQRLGYQWDLFSDEKGVPVSVMHTIYINEFPTCYGKFPCKIIVLLVSAFFFCFFFQLFWDDGDLRSWKRLIRNCISEQICKGLRVYKLTDFLKIKILNQTRDHFVSWKFCVSARKSVPGCKTGNWITFIAMTLGHSSCQI